MAETPRILSTLQRIAETARKIGSKSRPVHKALNTPVILKSLPEHRPLLPLLLSYNIPSKLAQTCADRYDKYANQLRSEAETKFAPYLLKRPNHAAGVYSVFLDSYSQTLQRWAQSILNAALKSLKRNSVEIENLDVTYPKPLWLPSSPGHHLAHKSAGTEESSPLSSASAPPHAFPTTYPPPHRPSTEIPSVELRRIPETLPVSRSTFAFDIDSLCLQFAKSLVIEENPLPSPEHKASIFALPATLKGEPDIGSSCTKPSKRKPSRSCRKPPTVKPTPPTVPTRSVKLRRLSVPPSSTSNVRPTPRKISAPVVISQKMPAPPMSLDSYRRTTPTSSFSSVPPTPIPANDLATNPDSWPIIHSVCPQFSFDSKLDSATFTAQSSSYSLSTPTTPPTITPALFSEPVVVSPIPAQLSPDPFQTYITDSFTQFQLQYDYLSSVPLISSPSHSASSLGLVAGGLYSKGVFDTHLAPGCISGEVF